MSTDNSFPTFAEYINKIKEFYTKHSPLIYFRVAMISPSRFQLRDAYFVKRDYDSEIDYMGKFKKTPKYIFSVKDVNFKKPLTRKDRLISYNTDEGIVNIESKLPFEVYTNE